MRLPAPVWRPQTIRQRLVLGVSTVVSVVMAAMGGLYVYSLRDYAIDLIDERLTHSLAAFSHSLAKSTYTDAHPQLFGTEGPEVLTDFTGQAPGTLIAVLHDGAVVGSAVFSDGEPRPAPVDAVRSLEAITWPGDESPFSVDLGRLGQHRVQSRAIDGAHTLVSGVSLERVNAAVVRKSVSAAGLVLLALVVCAAGTVIAIRVGLRPLRRVAATAAGVAKLPLADPGHRITARVADADTDPDNEVAIVGRALNRLLANVDSALVERAESDRRIRRFLSDASHELRTPLAAIQGYAELTRQDRAELPDTTEYALARIESESRRMASLVDDLLLLSRLDEGQGLLTEEVDLNDVLIDAVNDIAVSATEHHWHLELPEIPVRVLGDRARLHQLLSNLLANASVHTPPGTTVTASLRLRADDTGVVAEVAVEDNGPGIPAELLPHLFDRFVRADTSRSREAGNSGLGLAIVQSIAEAHNGSVAVRSDGGGTTFTVELPDLVLTYGDVVGQRVGAGTP